MAVTIVVLLYAAVVAFCSAEDRTLPTWITDNPHYKNSTPVDMANLTGWETVELNGSRALCHTIKLNTESGYGVEIVLEKLVLKRDVDYLMIAGCPILTSGVQILTGNHVKNYTIRIPNSKAFVLLFEVSEESFGSSYLKLRYQRFGNSYERRPPPREKPARKETLYGVYLGGAEAKDYTPGSGFVTELKKVIHRNAKDFCKHNNITFHDKSPDEMVKFNRVGSCPLGWPNRHKCVYLEHFVHVSGELDEDLNGYQLTSENLEKMWAEYPLGNVSGLEMEVFILPETTSIISWWVAVAGIGVVASLSTILVCWNIEKRMRRPNVDSGTSEVAILKKKPKPRPIRHQQLPAYMMPGKESNVDSMRPDEPPLKSYCGGLLFSDNKAFEGDEPNEEISRN